MSSTVSELTEVQNNYDNRFNCVICWYPKLRMVYGRCQHRICAECLYDDNGICREDLLRCPTCQKPHSFPISRPGIPDDNIETQRCLGVRECPNRDCNEQMWEWELEDHIKACPNREDTPVREVSPPQKARRRRSTAPQTSSESNMSKRVTRSSLAPKQEGRVQRRRSARFNAMAVS